MRRFFIEPGSRVGQVATLDREETHHCLRVLRLRSGESVELIDGEGGLYRGTLSVSGRRVDVHQVVKVAEEGEPEWPLLVFQGDLKGKKMDEVVLRCTELGVAGFFPFTSSRSQGRLAEERWERKQQRWRELVRSACKQSGRLRFMEVAAEQTIEQCLAAPLASAAVKLLCWEEERTWRLSMVDWRSGPGAVCLMMGPEGGFAAEEVVLGRRHGWQPASLGNRVLRAETATLAAVAIVQHLIDTRAAPGS